MQFEVDTTYTRFCSFVQDGVCPFGPSNDTGFRTSYLLDNAYYFISVSSEIAVIDPSVNADIVACISASITPTFHSSVYSALVFVPVGILLFLGFSIVLSAIYNPWTGTKDFYSWSSNFGQDPNALRLVTPGFGDLLQYLQFAYLLASLNLDFPGFYQPAMSASSWASLQFNISLASHESRDVGIDNIYAVDGSYGLSNLSQLVGLGKDYDVWTSFIVWLLTITGIVLLVSQTTYGLKWLTRKLNGHHSIDLRSKNLPSTVGMIVRLYLGYFSLPLVSFSTFQLLRSPHSPAYISAFAGVLLVGWIVSAFLVIRFIRQTRPQQALYDDLPTLLCLGPLYNTYRERGFMFCIVQIICTLVRGIFFGAGQPAAIAQIAVLAVLEIVYLSSTIIFRPFHRATKMNIYHMIISFARLICIMFSIPFIGSLGVSDTAKGWFAYTILLIHALILVFIFFAHALVAVVETLAQLTGVTSDSSNTFARAFGLRQLTHRRKAQEMDIGSNHLDLEITRSFAIMPEEQSLGHSPLQSSLSGNILDNLAIHHSAGGIPPYPASSQVGASASPISPGTAYGYYRMPRQPRVRSSSQGWSPSLTTEDDNKTSNFLSVGERESSSNSSQKKADLFTSTGSSTRGGASSAGEKESWAEIEPNEEDFLWREESTLAHTPKNVDYAVRESDVYFNLRKQRQLSLAQTSTSSAAGTGIGISGVDGLPTDLPSEAAETEPKSVFSSKIRTPLSAGARYSRKLGTGPADPTSVGAGVKGWFSKRLNEASDRLHIGNRNKGFVVVRNAPLRTVDSSEDEVAIPTTSSAPAVQTPKVGNTFVVEDAGPSVLRKGTKDLNIVVDQAVPKNRFTPIIKSPVPPALRRQQQQSQLIAYTPTADGEAALSPSSSSVVQLTGGEQDSLLRVQEDDRRVNSSSVGEVRSMRVGDMIRSSDYAVIEHEARHLEP